MKILHLVSSISTINFGVWNAAIIGSSYLRKAYNIHSELWICTRTTNDTMEPQIPYFYFDKNQMTGKGFHRWISQYSRKDTIIVTHGAYRKPTFIGYRAKRAGYKWIYLSQGMLEPWAFKNGWAKKKVYFELLEKRMCRNADYIRAVSEPEKKNLQRLFKKRIILIHNGISYQQRDVFDQKPSTPIVYLFLARLQYKKGILPLVKAWKNIMANKDGVKLLIVGPDEGELNKITPYFGNNIEYLGPLFGDDKNNILIHSHYYILPSFSEGFPSSVVEAMSYGMIPIISEGCNFPQVFEQELGYEIEPDVESLEKTLMEISKKPFDYDLSRQNITYVENNLSDKVIGEKLFHLYSELLLE